jgi:hypothetical protein
VATLMAEQKPKPPPMTDAALRILAKLIVDQLVREREQRKRGV